MSRWFIPGGIAVLNGAVRAGAAVLVAASIPGLRKATLLVDGTESDDEERGGPPADAAESGPSSVPATPPRSATDP
ncbi:hypothetical protein ACIGD1_25980 [Streptomyces sp. NPDC085612]|uniref:hypothetical protein n=1 Tax=Streptomyces sp. NPDC085612 TaxID=3365732 RepID=UPI0037D0E27B